MQVVKDSQAFMKKLEELEANKLVKYKFLKALIEQRWSFVKHDRVANAKQRIPPLKRAWRDTVGDMLESVQIV